MDKRGSRIDGPKLLLAFCLAVTLSGCGKKPEPAASPSASPSASPVESASATVLSNTPEPSAAPSGDAAAATPEASDATSPSGGAEATANATSKAIDGISFGKAHVSVPKGMYLVSSKLEDGTYAKENDAYLNSYYLKSSDPNGDAHVILARVFNNSKLYEDPAAKETRDAALACVKKTVYPKIRALLPDETFTPVFEEAQLTEGTYKTDAGDLAMFEIQTQDAYWLRAVIAPDGMGIVVLFGFSKGDKGPINEFINSLTIAA